MRSLVSILLMTGCSQGNPTPTDETLDFCDRPSIADGSLGRSFLLNHCTGCHSSENSPLERNGAPEELNYDTHPAFMENVDRVQAHCAVNTAHPCDDILPQEVEVFLGWLECGAPNTTTEFSTHASPPIGESFEVLTYVRELPEGIAVTRQIEVGSRGFFPESPWSRTLFERYGEEVWLYSETLYREDGSVLISIDFGTGLLIARPGVSVLTDTLEVEIQEDGNWTTEVIDFEITRGQGEVVDGRESNHQPEEIRIQSSHGLEWIWHYSMDGPPTAQATWLDEDRTWTALGILDYQGPPMGILGLTEGSQWIDRVHVPGGWSR
jgi:hypothetical protein